jgi:enoyl-CoA hydratase
MSYELLTLEIRDDKVAVITLNRPPVNALNLALVGELGRAIEVLSNTEGLRAVVLTGAGRAFVAGADIAQMRDFSAAQAARFAQEGQTVLSRLETLPVPVIAAVNGFALGGGCELAMCCDIILAGPKALFGQPEVKLGVIPGFGGTQRLTRLVGRQRARELCYTGRVVKAAEAVEIGLALKVVEGDVVEAALALAAEISANGPYAVQLAKRAINQGADEELPAALAREATLFGLCFATHDQTEGMAAFLEKRDPEFTGA